MSNFALLKTEAQEVLENDRKKFLDKTLEHIKTLQQDAAFAALTGVARKAVNHYPELRYVTIDRPGKPKDSRHLRVSVVHNTDMSVLSGSGHHRSLCWAVEDLLRSEGIHNYPALESGQYDFMELAKRQF